MGLTRTLLDVLTRGWLWLGLILMPILAHAGGLGFQPFPFFLGCGAWLVIAANWKEASFLKGPWLPLFLGFTLWAWLATLWSPHEADMLRGGGARLVIFALMLVPLPIVFLRLTATHRILLGHILMAGTVLGAGGMLFDVMSGYALSTVVDPVAADSNIYIRQGDAERSLGRGLMAYSQLLWPAIILMGLSFRRGWVLAIGVLSVFAVTALLNRLSLTLPILALTTAFVWITWYRPRQGLILAFGLAVFCIGFAPLLGLVSGLFDDPALANLPLSWEHRVRMWAYVWEQVQMQWVLGNGFDVSRTYQDTFTARDGRDLVIVSLHPHNIGLQIWLETGVIGASLAMAFLLSLIRPVLKACKSSARAAALTGVVVATSLNGALTIGVWQYWWWGLIALAVCLILLIPERVDGSTID